MPTNIKGTTDATKAVSVGPAQSKTVCIIGTRGANPTATQLQVVDLYSTTDAEAKFGTGSKVPEIVKVLANGNVASVKGIMIPAVGGSYPAKADTVKAALDELLKDRSIDILVTDDIDATVFAKYKEHLDNAEDEGIMRYFMAPHGATTANTDLITLADTINHKRIFIAGPQLTDTNATPLTGIYTAAGLAAMMATETSDPALPANGVELPGFGGVQRVLLSADKDTLADAGVTALYTAPSGLPAVYKFVSTYTKDADGQDDITWHDATTVMIADDILLSMQDRIRSNYKRTKNVARILNAIRTDIIDVLQTKQDLEIIESFDDKLVSVIKDPADVFGALVDYSFDVVTPLYTITIRQHMKL